MAAFPVIYRYGTTVHNPTGESLKNVIAHNPTIRSQSDGGYITTRARFTRITRSWPALRYEWLTTANKDALLDFESDTVVGGSNSFTWTNPLDSTSYTVRLSSLMHFTPHPKTNFLFWQAEFGLEAV